MATATRKAIGAVNTWALRNQVSYDSPVTVAVSGGADSLALMYAVSRSKFKDVTVLTVDHGIQEHSALQASKVASQAQELGLKCVVEKVSTPCSENSGNMEALARQGRYEVFSKYSLVLIAHTANDQAETMLLGMGRGSGSRSISGMREFRDQKYGRPLLGLTRKDTSAICRENDLEVWDDPHNDHLTFKRVKVRKKVLPALFDVFGEGILKNFSRTAILLQEDADALDQLSEDYVPSESNENFMPPLDHLPVAIQKRIIRNWLSQHVVKSEAMKATLVDTVLYLENGKQAPFTKHLSVVKTKAGWGILETPSLNYPGIIAALNRG